MLRERLINLLTEAAVKAQKEGKLPSVALPEITIERPQNAEHGDYASNFPLKLARIARANPMVIANELVALLPVTEEIGRIIMAGGSAPDIKAQAVREGVWGLRQAGLNKVRHGITSLDEINRVTVD